MAALENPRHDTVSAVDQTSAPHEVSPFMPPLRSGGRAAALPRLSGAEYAALTQHCADPEPPPARRTIAPQDRNNFRYTGAIALPEVSAAPHSDVTARRDAPALGMSRHSVDPASDIDNTSVANGRWPLGWLDLSQNGQGAPRNHGTIDRVMLVRCASEPLQGQRLSLERIADDLGERTHDQTGEPFAGFTAQDTWLIALRCSTWPDPAPLFLTTLHPLE